jgi:hypothetical protein
MYTYKTPSYYCPPDYSSSSSKFSTDSGFDPLAIIVPVLAVSFIIFLVVLIICIRRYKNRHANQISTNIASSDLNVTGMSMMTTPGKQNMSMFGGPQPMMMAPPMMGPPPMMMGPPPMMMGPPPMMMGPPPMMMGPPPMMMGPPQSLPIVGPNGQMFM